MRIVPVILLAALVLSGCATAPRPAPNPEQAWAARRVHLADLNAWSLTGRIAVSTEEEAGHAHLAWRQERDHYDIQITAPFGAGQVRLAGDSADAALWVDQKPPVRASDPELLLYSQTGWWIPVEALRYWIVGVPAPRLHARWQLDPYGRLKSLQQAGWSIQFLDYERRDGLELPGRVFVSNGQAKVKVVVQSWRRAAATRPTSVETPGHG